MQEKKINLVFFPAKHNPLDKKKVIVFNVNERGQGLGAEKGPNVSLSFLLKETCKNWLKYFFSFSFVYLIIHLFTWSFNSWQAVIIFPFSCSLVFHGALRWLITKPVSSIIEQVHELNLFSSCCTSSCQAATRPNIYLIKSAGWAQVKFFREIFLFFFFEKFTYHDKNLPRNCIFALSQPLICWYSIV